MDFLNVASLTPLDSLANPWTFILSQLLTFSHSGLSRKGSKANFIDKSLLNLKTARSLSSKGIITSKGFRNTSGAISI